MLGVALLVGAAATIVVLRECRAARVTDDSAVENMEAGQLFSGTTYSPEITLPSTGDHTATLIFLHGLGDTGSGWRHIADALRVRGLKVVLPSANRIPVTLNGGMRMPAWYDIIALAADAHQDHVRIAEATRYVHSLLKKEISAGVPANRIILGGFSQGAAMALYAGLTFKAPLGGIIALSGYLPLAQSLTPDAIGDSLRTPVLMCHGDRDPVVQFGFGDASSKMMSSLGVTVEFRAYRGLGHTSSPEEMHDVRRFVASILAAV